MTPHPSRPISSSPLWVGVVLLAATSGCQTAQYSASTLPPGLRAQPGAGRQQVQLAGVATAGGSSTALAADDLLDLSIGSGIAEEELEPIEVRVAADGTVAVPLVGAVHVLGLEPSAAAERIRNEAVNRGIYRRPEVHVAIDEKASYEITVLGAVDEPGVHKVPRGACNIMSAIAAAGGFAEESGTVVDVMRRSARSGLADALPASGGRAAEGVQTVSFDAPPLSASTGGAPERFDLANLGQNPGVNQQLADRDVIFVRPKEDRVVHVSGLVANPNQFTLTEDHDLRVLDAIAMAGGVTTQVADKVLVIRRTEDSPQPVGIEVSLARAKKSGEENLLLQSGDLVSVEATVATTVTDVFSQLLRISLGVGGNLSLF